MEKATKLEFHNEQESLLSVTCCGFSKTEAGHSFGPALKPHYLIHYVLSGRGRFVLDNKTYHLEAGNGFLIQPGELAFYEADENDPWIYVWVGFNGTLAKTYLDEAGLAGGHPIFTSSHADELHKAVRNMMDNSTSKPEQALRRMGELAVFLSVIAADMPGNGEHTADRADSYVQRAVSFIKSNYCNPIKVSDIADYVCLNRSYLYTLFEENMGMSPQQYLSMYRLTMAAELLSTTDLTIESIALSCGYRNALVFTKAFKSLKKMAPTVYRKNKNLTF